MLKGIDKEGSFWKPARGFGWSEVIAPSADQFSGQDDPYQHNFSRLFLAMLMAVSIIAVGGCREQEPWDTDIAVKVNGRPIPKAALDRVLEWGFYPDLDQGGEREINIPLILDKLINEELILGEAEKIGLVLSPGELSEGLDNLSSVWFGGEPPQAEQAELRQAVARHLLLRKMTEKVINDRKVLSAEKWHDFWEKWPKNKGPSFKMRALLLPPTDDEPQRPAEIKKLEDLADYFKSQGAAVILSQALWLSGERLDLVISEELSRAFKEKRLSLPIRLDESWAIYEVLSRDLGPGAAEEFEAARRVFEAKAGEEAFQRWLSEIRSEAVVEYAPYLGLPGGSFEMTRMD